MIGLTTLAKVSINSEAENFRLAVLNREIINKFFIGLDQIYEENENIKVLFLSFSASYCKPCRKELPFLQKLFRKYRDRGFYVLYITIDNTPQGIETMKALLKENGITFPVLSDKYNIVARRYGISNLPSLFILDENRVIKKIHRGYNEDISKELESYIKEIIANKSNEPKQGDMNKKNSKDSGG